MFTPNASYGSQRTSVSTYKPPTMTQGSFLTNSGSIYRRAISRPRYPNPTTGYIPNYQTQSTGTETTYIAHRCISTDRSSGSVIQRRKAIATGRSMITPGQKNPASYSNNDANIVRKHLNRTRNLGQIIPPKTRGYLPNTGITPHPRACALF